MESKLYEMLGRKQAELEDRTAQYSKLLKFLGAVISGEIDRSRVMVNMTEQSYSWCEPGQRPGMPATINGLPIVVVAPDEPDIGELIRQGRLQKVEANGNA